MNALARFAPLMMLGAAQPPAAVPLGEFKTWGIRPSEPLHLAAGGLALDVVATPCERPPQNEGCNFEGVSNQASVTVTQPGLPRFRMTSDRQASFVRVAIVRLAAGQARASVVVDNQWGGSAGDTAVTVVQPFTAGFRAVSLEHDGRTALRGEVQLLPPGTLPGGQPGFVLEAPIMNYSGECNACVPRPPLVLTVHDGRSVDVSADPALRPLFARDLPLRRRVCVSTERERNANCAAFMADAARLGQIASAWPVMLAHYRHEPAGYPAALRSFLVQEGYIAPVAARTLPLEQTITMK